MRSTCRGNRTLRCCTTRFRQERLHPQLQNTGTGTGEVGPPTCADSGNNLTGYCTRQALNSRALTRPGRCSSRGRSTCMHTHVRVTTPRSHPKAHHAQKEISRVTVCVVLASNSAQSTCRKIVGWTPLGYRSGLRTITAHGHN